MPGPFLAWPSPSRASAASSCISGSSWGTWPSAGARHPFPPAPSASCCCFPASCSASWPPGPSTASPSASATRRPSASSRCSCSSCLRGAWPTAPATPTRPPRWAACPSLPQFHQAQGRIPLPKAEAPMQQRGSYAAAETYGLSPREVEVTALLLRGRSIPYICDELFIAKSTAQTHVRHIYAKMNITGGRQELIDRIEGSD
ncbi:helix-turn-helix transcriptional regulator [uncultured Adlercreutzia sp.]|uniref:helix-turn-helix transcriptional regulator n=1 Tax=uncultured Adlercreutzia sp. TaxID=875803 RepID=UPI00349F6BC4